MKITQQNWQQAADAFADQMESDVLFRTAILDALHTLAAKQRKRIIDLKSEAAMKKVYETNTEESDFAFEELSKLEKKTNEYIADNLLSIDQLISEYTELIQGKSFGQVYPD